MSLGPIEEGSQGGQSATHLSNRTSQPRSDQNITFLGPDHWRPPIEATYVAPNVVELAALMLQLLDNYCEHWGVTRSTVADAFAALDGVKDDTRRLWADFMTRHCPSSSGNVPLAVLTNEMRLPSIQRTGLPQSDALRPEMPHPTATITVNMSGTPPSDLNDHGPERAEPETIDADVEPVQQPVDVTSMAPESGNSDVRSVTLDASEDEQVSEDDEEDQFLDDVSLPRNPSVEIVNNNIPDPVWATIRRTDPNSEGTRVILCNIKVEDLPLTKSGSWPRVLHEPEFHENGPGLITRDARFETLELQLQESVLKARKTLRDVFKLITEPINSDPPCGWAGYIDAAVAGHYVFINWPYGLPPAKNWKDNNPCNQSTKPLAILLAALLHEDPKKRLCLISRRHFPDNAQPALISYVPTYGDMVISDEETITIEGKPVISSVLPDFNGPCGCNLDGCRPPDLGAYERLRPRWTPRIDGSVDRRRKREEPSGNYAARFVGPASKRPKVKTIQVEI
ncbi:hypothetical protein SISNIDRAFT_489506 [Sistotremastrum niveocremeum HHB9708]|uniref:Uncharacterized protein n=1 Tax=Sistotremastrum niveocremeum HHB9708 TaxID=1314777 RepID=A0A164PV52_9AGAM|nr:hypothetical protein SISNIDRAFT_489506 [Sistotremastrum niveocremeum HHB9708]